MMLVILSLGWMFFGFMNSQTGDHYFDPPIGVHTDSAVQSKCTLITSELGHFKILIPIKTFADKNNLTYGMYVQCNRSP